MRPEPRFGVVIVNYECAPFALDAALSALGDGAAKVIIVDNASRDDSLDYFQRALANPKDHAPVAPNGPAPVAFAPLSDLSTAIVGEYDIARAPAELVVVAARSNDGFAAGCNIGLVALHAARETDHYLLLNPDALVAKGALEEFAARLAGPGAGLCGASVLAFDPPFAAQACGGAALHGITLLGDNLGAGMTLDKAPQRDEVEKRLDYPLGAAIALRSSYVDAAGFLDERYFLYYEEADWAMAGRRAGQPVWAREAVVYHRYGASSKSRRAEGGGPVIRSPDADYHMARSRLLFALKWRPWLIPSLIAMGELQALRRLMRGRRRQARAVALGSLPGAPDEFAAG